MTGSQFLQNFQNQDPYFFLQVTPQEEEEPIDLKNNMEVMIQCQNDFNQSINRAELDQLCNPMIDRNEETLPKTFLTIYDFSNHIDNT